MKKNTETLERLNAFVGENGGIYTVAEKIGKSPQVFYSMFRRGSLPSLDLLLLLRDAYSHFDLNWVVTGQRPARVADPTPELEELRQKNRILQTMYESAIERAVRANMPGKAKGEAYRPGESRFKRVLRVGEILRANRRLTVAPVLRRGVRKW